MSEFISLTIVALVIWIISRWFKLVWFRSKTLQVLKIDFDYTPDIPGNHSVIFNEVTRSAKSRKLTEYDASIAFMISQFHQLSEPHTTEAKKFISKHLSNIHRIIPYSLVGLELYREYLRVNPETVKNSA